MTTEELKAKCLNKDVNEVTEMLEKEYGAKWADEKYDDCGDEDGTYVMKRVLSLGGGYVDLYYLDVEGLVSCVTIENVTL